MIIKMPEKYSFWDTLYPSFIFPFFKKNGSFVKKIGLYSGVRIRIEDEELIVEGEVPRDYVLEWTGLWFTPEGGKDKLKILIETYSRIRLAISSCDREYVFISVFLSQNTDFHTNTCRWIKKLSEIYGSNFLERIDLRFRTAGTSYQLARLEQTYPEFRQKILDEKDPGSLRLKLLSIKGVGPKIADAYILFSSRHPESTPCDIHLRRFVDRLGFIEYRRLPSKNYCRKYYCWLKSECPVHEECLRFLMMNKYGRLSGWIQTIAYYHDKLYCSKRKCSICPLRELCAYK